MISILKNIEHEGAASQETCLVNSIHGQTGCLKVSGKQVPSVAGGYKGFNRANDFPAPCLTHPQSPNSGVSRGAIRKQ